MCAIRPIRNGDGRKKCIVINYIVYIITMTNRRYYNANDKSTPTAHLFYANLAYPCAESVNIRNGFGVGHDTDMDGLGLRVRPSGHCGGSSSTASVSSDSALSRRKQLHIHGASATFSVETMHRQQNQKEDKCI